MPYLPPIPAAWKGLLYEETKKNGFVKLNEFLNEQEKQGKILFPEKNNIFKVFELVTPEEIKVVILGQDPYHGEGQAQGLSFSVPDGAKQPPSLKNIFKELKTDLGIEKKQGDLTPWARQGVFLLNAILTVEKSKPSSHKKKGWEEFTDKVIEYISSSNESVAFVLWGNYAQGKCKLIDSTKHLIISKPHPSPRSAYKGFFGSKVFSEINNYLAANGKTKINW